MSSVLKSLRALSDATRLRLIALLEKDELSVHEFQEITGMGQSRISTHLGLLQGAGLVQSRREGKRTFYRLNPEARKDGADFLKLALQGAKELLSLHPHLLLSLHPHLFPPLHPHLHLLRHLSPILRPPQRPMRNPTRIRSFLKTGSLPI